ncbi:MAG: DUF3108 domain-containing protein [Methyloceanibacter sp.]|uniref:DUF3108 domain-containing protein n=1 Tax=Methyloceanibacter sp. TaxID=1965321 RepID=UPI003D6C85B2
MGWRRYGPIIAVLLLAGVAPDRSGGEAAPPGPGKIVATYDTALGGVSLGTFQVTATFKGGAYEMAADGKFSLLAGLLYSVSGKTTSRGELTEAAPQPARFTLEYKGDKKREQRRLSFRDGTVSDVIIVPKKRRKRDVPISAKQLKNVLDPLTAAFLALRSDAPAGNQQVCNQTIPIFDGRQRFDIVLSPKRIESLKDASSGALPGPAAVCQVQYQPIGGYRPDHPGVQFMTKTEDIEAWLVPVPRTGFHFPYKILIPTAWGTGSITLTSISAKLGEPQRASAP